MSDIGLELHACSSNVVFPQIHGDACKGLRIPSSHGCQTAELFS